MRLARGRLVAVACGLGVLVLATNFGRSALYPVYLRIFDNPRYADTVFAGHVDYDKVLATRRWHRHGAEAWDCSYAVVSLTEGAPDAPPDLPDNRHRQPWYLAYGGAWAPTPAPPLGESTRDALALCARYFSDDVNRRLTSAMAEPGSWHMIGSVGATVHIYSAPQRIAARIRYGD